MSFSHSIQHFLFGWLPWLAELALLYDSSRTYFELALVLNQLNEADRVHLCQKCELFDEDGENLLGWLEPQVSQTHSTAIDLSGICLVSFPSHTQLAFLRRSSSSVGALVRVPHAC